MENSTGGRKSRRKKFKYCNSFGQIINSQEKLTNKFSESFLDKINNIKN